MKVKFQFLDPMGGAGRETTVEISDDWDGQRVYSIGSSGGSISNRDSVINNTMNTVSNMLFERSGRWGSGHLSTLKGDRDILYV
jgi:hypothetical protein